MHRNFLPFFSGLLFFGLVALNACEEDDTVIVDSSDQDSTMVVEDDPGGTCYSLQINPNLALDSLPNFLEGTGVTIANIQTNVDYPHHNAPMAFFLQKCGNIFGLKEGFLMTTGSASNAVGPNDQSGASQQNSGADPMEDEDLQTLESELPLYDICVIEFDVQVAASELKFEYVFASEEYPEFVFENYNDVFGLFISGPGIEEVQNLALINNAPVSIDNLNSLTNAQFYNNNGDGSTPSLHQKLQYDGFSDVLTASAPVVPGETYHIKLAIADVGDGIFDSGIFIGAGSFRSLVDSNAAELKQSALWNTLDGFVGVNESTSINDPEIEELKQRRLKK